jgi:class 3 adenylate cyclase/tetratricopeptide (TPR) repeat protein
MSSAAPLERRQLTVMMCDLVGWTSLSLKLDAEELTELVRAYRQRCGTIINAHGGTVAQYVGDAVMAYFGYPRAHEDDAERAIRAALAIVSARGSARGAADSEVHIGIATGEVVVGNLGGVGGPLAGGGTVPAVRDDVSAVGSAPNLAARLQALAEPGRVVVSEQTRTLAGGIFEYADLGRHVLKGVDDPVHAWEVVGESTVRSRFHALRASASAPLVNRRAELQELRELWNSVQAGEGRALLLTGEPGVGKSRLADEVARQIVDRRCLTLWYYCSPHLQSSPLAPLVRQLSFAIGFTEKDDDDAKLRKLVGLTAKFADVASESVPLLADLMSVRYEDKYRPLSMSAQRRKHRLFEVLLQLLDALTSRRPILLVVEDLHWIDPSSDELLGMVVDRLKSLPILAILTARPEFQPHWHAGAHLLHMRLGPLDRSDSIAMIELLCGGRKVPAPTVAQIAERTDGLPLFIEDLTKDVLELADLERTDGAAAMERARSSSAIPTTLTGSLMSRLDRLGSAKAVAQLGAVIGREFSYELIAKVAQLPEEDLREELYRLVASGLLASRPSTPVRMYAFKHALVRDAAYSSLLKKAQAALHSRIAQVLVADFPETAESQPEVLAHHFEAAGDIENAVQSLLKAAKLSAKRSGFLEAIAQLQSGLRLLGARSRSRERMQLELRVRLALGGIYAEYRGFSSAECANAYQAALELCRELGDAAETFAVLSGVGSVEITRANFSQCRALAEECLARAAQQQAKPPFVMGHLLLGGTLFLTGELTAARKELEQALAIYEQDKMARHGKQVLYVQEQKSTGLCFLALTLTILGHLDRGLQAAHEGLGHSESLGGPHTINFSLCYLAAVHHIRRGSREALRRATESLELAREQSFATWIGVSQMIRGAALVRTGELAKGLEEIAAGMRAHSQMGAITYQPFGISLFVEGLIAAGRLDEALEALAQALATSERTGERFYLAELWRLKGEILAQQGRRSEAEHSLREAIELSRQQSAKLFELRSGTSLCRLVDGSRREAVLHEVLEPAYKWFEQGIDTPDLEDARALLTGGKGAGGPA